MIALKIARFQFKDFWKTGICFVLTFAYALLEIFVLQVEKDPMYFMPGGDIQAGILRMDYGLYLTLYILVFLTYVITTHILGDRQNAKTFFLRLQKVKNNI